MARKPSESLTEVEQRIMEVLWSDGSGTVGEVLKQVQTSNPVAFNTVQTILRILEHKGFVRHTEEGRAFRYHPLVAREQASNTALQSLLRRFYDGSAGSLALNLLESERLTEEELQQIRELVRKGGEKR
jgi:BlaI family transcriptional regulator, penicillinase repressor